MGAKCNQCGREMDMSFEGECRDCYSSRFYDYDDNDYDDNDCANCGGEGWVSHCFEEWACMHPDEGCDLCMRRCDWCNQPKPTPESEELRRLLPNALNDTPTPAGDQLPVTEGEK